MFFHTAFHESLVLLSHPLPSSFPTLLPPPLFSPLVHLLSFHIYSIIPLFFSFIKLHIFLIHSSFGYFCLPLLDFSRSPASSLLRPFLPSILPLGFHFTHNLLILFSKGCLENLFLVSWLLFVLQVKQFKDPKPESTYESDYAAFLSCTWKNHFIYIFFSSIPFLTDFLYS